MIKKIILLFFLKKYRNKENERNIIILRKKLSFTLILSFFNYAYHTYHSNKNMIIGSLPRLFIMWTEWLCSMVRMASIRIAVSVKVVFSFVS